MSVTDKKIETIGLRLDDGLLREAKGIAESLDLGLSEWIRLLMTSAVDQERKKYQALHNIFGQASE